VVADAIRSYVRDVMLSHNDATEEQREKTESQRRLLNSELNHRVKNILALVKSIANETGANADTVDDYAKSFEGRLRARSHAHDQSFGGSGGGELRGLIEAEAGMHRFGKMPEKIAIAGEEIGLTERAFGVFALSLHEMMTNAKKYGSLSVPSGRLDIAWSLTPAGDCLLSWLESGGPEVTLPTRRGFGSNLIEKTISHDLGGTVDIEFARAGLKAEVILPKIHLRPLSNRRTASPMETAAPRSLEGKHILLVEDQSLIAMDTEELLRAIGAHKVTVAATVDAALRAISADEPHCAVLDLNLGMTTSEDVAKELQLRKIPYVFATGYRRDGASIPDGFSTVPVVRKPVSENALAVAMGDALRDRDGNA
jgi:two-component sensor histidine kinase